DEKEHQAHDRALRFARCSRMRPPCWVQEVHGECRADRGADARVAVAHGDVTVYSIQMRTNMASHLEHELRGRIVRQELAPGSRINEVHVAEDLGVSRTPLREALTRLEVEALVESR